ncbi:MAG: hypothetical protein GX415_03145 [Chloroflexi bacterium]|jgi:hypothetical protein|nr:hypothetical protein [Anaerolineaceae bacterium]NLI44395.1 hypothetical protein [Chloroflexota bacterium]HOE34432.1 hypothetical protein [Anaerolineaceae bacterium]HOT25442.1 hypothetical protein [Anaerolineaceae bacterium]HQH57428.1 hypothetical protein [Anaerolineaceae bacterium]
MIHQLTPQWTIELPEGFQHRKEESYIIFWTAGITIAVAVFSYSGPPERAALLANLRARAQAEKLKMIEEQEGTLIRFGSMQLEAISPKHTRLALHAFSMAEYGCAQTSFYLDNAADFQQALRIWQKVLYTPAEL